LPGIAVGRNGGAHRGAEQREGQDAANQWTAGFSHSGLRSNPAPECIPKAAPGQRERRLAVSDPLDEGMIRYHLPDTATLLNTDRERTTRMKRTFLLAVLLAGAAITGLVAQSPDLTAEGKAWWAHVQYLADDRLEGRNVGTPGYETAAKYVESQFQAIGLKPGGAGGFRQPVKLDSRTLVPDQSTLALVRDGKEEPLVIGQDATFSARAELNGDLEASAVFVGYGLSIPEAGWDDFAGLDLKGKVAVYVNAFPPVKVTDNVKSHVNTADERWLGLKRAGAIGVATIGAPRAGGGGAAGGGGRGWRTGVAGGRRHRRPGG
jgi:hypothetical protein